MVEGKVSGGEIVPIDYTTHKSCPECGTGVACGFKHLKVCPTCGKKFSYFSRLRWYLTGASEAFSLPHDCGYGLTKEEWEERLREIEGRKGHKWGPE